MNILNECYFSVPDKAPDDIADKFMVLLRSRLKNSVIVSDEQVRADEKVDDDIIVGWFQPLNITPMELDAQKPPLYDPNLLEIGPMANQINMIYTAAAIQMSIDKRSCLFQGLHDTRDLGDIRREKDSCYICIEIERAIHIQKKKKELRK